MQLSGFEVVIEKEPDDEGYAARSSTPPGCFSHGTTVEDAKCNIREVSQQQLETLLAHRSPHPPEQEARTRRGADGRGSDSPHRPQDRDRSFPGERGAGFRGSGAMGFQDRTPSIGVRSPTGWLRSRPSPQMRHRPW